jgi:iron complex outermembrane receptor protein
LNQVQTTGISRYAFDYLKSQFTASGFIKINENLDLSIRTRYENRMSYTAYWLWDSKLQYQQNRTVLFAEASNLFDITYKEVGNIIMPGRWIRFGMSFKLMMR